MPRQTTPHQQVNLQELVIALSKLTNDKGDPQASMDLMDLLAAGIHHAHMPESLKPGAAEMFQLTAEAIGGLPRMIRWADRYPASFYKLYARQTIPTIAPVLPQPTQQTSQQWPEWLTHRRLAYQEGEDALTDTSAGDEDASEV